jgi:hypothetical protein
MNPSTHVLYRALHGEGQAILTVAMTLLGVAVSYFFSMQANFDGSTKVLKRIFPSANETSIIRADMFFILFCGTLVAVGICDPATPAQAVGAGIGWVGLVNLGGGRPKKNETTVKLDLLQQALDEFSEHTRSDP